MTAEVRDRFTRLWLDHAARVAVYAARHVDRETAKDVVSETFLVAWRRLPDVPNDALPWLLVVARNTIANAQRANHRRDALHMQLERLEHLTRPTSGPDVTDSGRVDVLALLMQLTLTEREALLLVAWDGLTPTEAAAVLGCSPSTLHVRLFRAKRRLRRLSQGAAPTSSRLHTTAHSRSAS